MAPQHTALVDPQLRDMLATVGRRLPADVLAAIRTKPEHSLAAISDYGGTEASLRYETYVTYIVDLNSAWEVTDPLDAFKARNGIAERSMVFKSAGWPRDSHPGAPTDPDLRISRIRLVEDETRYGR